MSEEEIIGKINWAIHVNEMTKSINGDNTHVNVNDLKGLLDLYNKEKEKNKELENKIKEYEKIFNRQKELEQETNNLMKQGWL